MEELRRKYPQHLKKLLTIVVVKKKKGEEIIDTERITRERKVLVVNEYLQELKNGCREKFHAHTRPYDVCPATSYPFPYTGTKLSIFFFQVFLHFPLFRIKLHVYVRSLSAYIRMSRSICNMRPYTIHSALILIRTLGDGLAFCLGKKKKAERNKRQ